MHFLSQNVEEAMEIKCENHENNNKEIINAILFYSLWVKISLRSTRDATYSKNTKQIKIKLFSKVL